jgi:hypothetical protein
MARNDPSAYRDCETKKIKTACGNHHEDLADKYHEYFVCKCDETKQQKANQIKYNSTPSNALIAELHNAETRTQLENI